MAVDVAQASYVMIPLERIVSVLPVRRLSASGLKRIQSSMKRVGFLENFPLVIAPDGNGDYQLIEGRHRLEVARALDISPAPCVVKDGLSESERFKLALQCNDAAETMVPSTLVTHAEFVWARKEHHTLAGIAEIMGWSEAKVKQYSALSAIKSEAWDVIVTTFENAGNLVEDDEVTKEVTPVTFTEKLLRSILDLTPEQQLELVQSLVHPVKEQRITKGKFAELAKAYKSRNDMYAYCEALLKHLGESYITKLRDEVYSGAYDTDWQKSTEHPKLNKLIQSLIDEWERKNSIHLIEGDFFEEVKQIADGCIDLILTDPPYNIASEKVFAYEGRSSISQDFGAWDKLEHQAFIESLQECTRQWARILKSHGVGYVFTSDRYISHMREALLSAGLQVMSTLTWHKTNPGTSRDKINFISSTEFILYFVKGKGEHTFHWQGENEMHNFIEAPICGKSERLKDAKGETIHPTQKPEQVIRHLMEISSNRGDEVFDGFAGTGTTGKVAKDLQRKFIGIEQDKTFFEAMQRRLA